MPTINISNAAIEDISSERDLSYITVTYRDRQSRPGEVQTVRLVVRPRTVILNTNGIPVPVTALRRGMTINATISSAMTRSIPPQTSAFEIQIL